MITDVSQLAHQSQVAGPCAKSSAFSAACTASISYVFRPHAIRTADSFQVGADIVEVSPGYDHAEVTAMAAADLVQEFLALMTKKGKRVPAISRGVLAEPVPEPSSAGHDEL